MALDFGPRLIDFSPLGKLGATYDAGVKRNREAAMNDARQNALAGFGQNSDLAALGKTLLQAGDLEGGMAALRLQAANEGTPWQKAEAARQAGQFQTSLDEQKRRDDDAERARREAEERTRRPERITGVDKYDNPREGTRDPVSGVITWEDGTQTRTNPGPRSGGTDDPNLPQPNAATAQAMLSPQPSTDPGFVIPKTLQQFPPGTELPPGGPLAALAPPPAAGAAVAAPAAPAAAPLAPPAPAGGAAVAQAPPPGAAGGAVPGAPITQTQINQGTANIPAMSLEEQYQESQRLGMSMKAYRAARAAAIQKEMTSKGVDPEKALPQDIAAKMAIAETYLANAPKIRKAIENEDQTGFFNRLKGMAGVGRTGQVERQIASGVDALKRLLSGANLSPTEVDDYVKRYQPEMSDSKESLLSKHDQLVAEISRYRELGYRGRGTVPDLPAPVRDYGADTKPLDVGGTRDLGGGVTLKRIQ